MSAVLGAAYLDIPLGDPSAPSIIRRAEQHGFFWAALLPSARADGDVLRLQHLSDAAVDTEDVEFASEHGGRMGAFVGEERARVRG